MKLASDVQALCKVQTLSFVLQQGGSPKVTSKQAASPGGDIRLQPLHRQNADSGAASASDSEASDSEGATATSKPSHQQVLYELF